MARDAGHAQQIGREDEQRHGEERRRIERVDHALRENRHRQMIDKNDKRRGKPEADGDRQAREQENGEQRDEGQGHASGSTVCSPSVARHEKQIGRHGGEEDEAEDGRRVEDQVRNAHGGGGKLRRARKELVERPEHDAAESQRQQPADHAEAQLHLAGHHLRHEVHGHMLVVEKKPRHGEKHQRRGRRSGKARRPRAGRDRRRCDRRPGG